MIKPFIVLALASLLGCAQAPARAPVTPQAAAQRRLGEIYDTGNSAVARDYAESVRWYQQARENGEPLPEQPKVPSSPTAPTPRAWY